VLLNGVKALVAKVGGTEALKIIAKETAMVLCSSFYQYFWQLLSSYY
jgi:hypothetical protein